MNNIVSDNLKVLVFSSDIDTSRKAQQVQDEFRDIPGVYRVDIDLKDRENVLRVECHPNCSSRKVTTCISKLGFSCSTLL